MDEANWNALNTEEEIDLEKTLFSGQVFMFKQTGSNEYTGVVGECLVSFLQRDGSVFYKILYGGKSQEEMTREISYFFTLEIPFRPLLNKWGLDEEGKLAGLRTIRYDLVPTIFSFICSSNNNISRITKMVNFLYSKGDFMMEYKGFGFYHFPKLERLVSIEDELKQNSFGYRSRYICDAAKFLIENHAQIISNSPEDVRKALISVRGVGNKVADCISLIGMGSLGVVPIDTHIFNFARKEVKTRSLTDRTYRDVQKLYVEKFGKYAGIAQLYIFKEMLNSKMDRPKSL